MTARLLSHSEWPTVPGPFLPSVLTDVSPDGCQVFGVEKGGEVVGTVAVMTVVHLEGLWVHPEHRGPGIVRSLMEAAARAAKETTRHGWVFACIGSEEMAGYVERSGGTEVPVVLYVLPLGKE